MTRGPSSATPIRPELVDRRAFADKIRPSSSGCWEWVGARNALGYGRFTVDGRGVYAHRVAYALAVGELRAGLVVDHVCRNRACVRPEHLELVDQRQNVLRGVGPAARNARKTSCPEGHPLDEYRRADGRIWRRCDTCQRIDNARRRDAAALLGLSQRQYLKQYGASRAAAVAVLTRYGRTA